MEAITNLLDPLLMNAFNTVNLAGACLLTSVEYATEIGIPENRWIYPLGAAGTRDSYDCKCLLRGELALTDSSSLGTPKLLLEPLHLSITRRCHQSFWSDER